MIDDCLTVQELIAALQKAEPDSTVHILAGEKILPVTICEYGDGAGFRH